MLARVFLGLPYRGDLRGDPASCLPRRPPQIARPCGLRAMEARWISALVDGRAPPPVLGAPFFVFRVKVCRGGAQVVVAPSRAIRSSRLQPHLGGNVERLVGVVCSSLDSVARRRIWLWLNKWRKMVMLFGSTTTTSAGVGPAGPAIGDFPGVQGLLSIQGYKESRSDGAPPTAPWTKTWLSCRRTYSVSFIFCGGLSVIVPN